MSNENKNKKPSEGHIKGNVDWSDRGSKNQNNGNDIRKGIDFEIRPQRPEKPKTSDK